MIDNLKNAINHARKVAKEMRRQATIGLDSMTDTIRVERCKEYASEQEQLATYLEQLLAIQLLYKEYEGSGGGFHYQVGRVFDGDYVLDNKESENK